MEIKAEFFKGMVLLTVFLKHGLDLAFGNFRAVDVVVLYSPRSLELTSLKSVTAMQRVSFVSLLFCSRLNYSAELRVVLTGSISSQFKLYCIKLCLPQCPRFIFSAYYHIC